MVYGVSNHVQYKSIYAVSEGQNLESFGFKKKKDCTICVGKTKALISCAVTVQLICTFGFAYVDSWLSDVVAHII